MKILILAGYTPSLINFRLQLLKEFLKKGADVIACAPEYHKPTISQLNKLGIHFTQVNIDVTSMNPIKDLIVLVKLILLLQKEKPDVIFSYTIKPVIYGSIAARITNIPNIVSLITGLGFSSGSATTRQKIANEVSRFLYKISLKVNSVIFFQNPDDRLFFIKNNLLNNKAVIVNGSGVDLVKFSFKPILKNKTLNFLLIARLIRDKGIFEYVEAAKKIHKSYPKIKFNLLGYFYDTPNAISKQVVEQWNSEGIINYLGETLDVRPYLRDCHVFILPSYREGTPRSVLEAMATGRAIITTDVPGCRETVIDGQNGFLVKDHDSDSLAQAILKFIANSNLAIQMGKMSRRIAEKKYDVHKVNELIIKEMKI